MTGSTVKIDWNRNVVTQGETEFPFDPREYWIIAPSVSSWQPGDGVIGPLGFAYMLHNARVGEGFLPPLATLTEHFTPRSLKKGRALVAENLIEERRIAIYPEMPSRLTSYFLNTHRDTAEKRMKDWGWQDRMLVRCHILTTTGCLHAAFVSNFEELARNNSLTEFADRYWTETPSLITDKNKNNIEILADCALYFPDWVDFDLLDTKGLLAAQEEFHALWTQ